MPRREQKVTTPDPLKATAGASVSYCLIFGALSPIWRPTTRGVRSMQASGEQCEHC